MAITITSSIALAKPLPNFEREQYNTIEEMAAVKKAKMPDMMLGYCLEDNGVYLYVKTNDTDPVLGQWRKFEPGSGEVASKPVEVFYCTSNIKNVNINDMIYDKVEDFSISSDAQYIVIVSPKKLEIFDGNGLNNTNSFIHKEIEDDGSGWIIFDENEPIDDTGSYDSTEAATYNAYISETKVTCENFTYKIKEV